VAFVIVFTTIILVFQIIKQFTLSSAFAAVVCLLIAILYFVSASKIKARAPGAAGKRIATLARRVGGCLCGATVSSLLYVAADAAIPQNSVQLQVMVQVTAINLLQIMFHSLLHFFMAKFLNESAKRNRVGPGRLANSTNGTTAIVPSAPTATTTQPIAHG
jgi:hypothetical protein